MKSAHLLSSALLFAVLPALAGAATISNFNATLTTANATELGRPNRSGTPQTWLGAETYTGLLANSGTTPYYYTTYTFGASLFTNAPYVEISDYDTLRGTTDFLAAYAGSYNVASRGTGWLGDEGSSGNFFGTDARTFDVFLPVGQNLVLVFNGTTLGGGLNDPNNIEVDAYADTNYTDPPPAPEPSTFALLGTGVAGIAAAARRRSKGKA